MAGDWIKFEISTTDKPEVWEIANNLSIDPDAVIGKLLRVWAWFDQQTESGNATSVSKMLLDRLVGVSGFCDCVISVGWMIEDGKSISLPHFDRHNGKTAKSRAVTAKRVAAFKALGGKSNANGNAIVTPPPLPKEEKRREEVKDIAPSEREPVPVQDIINLFNKSFENLPEVKILSEKRRAMVKKRWAENKGLQTIERWEDFFEYVKKSDFLMGRSDNPFNMTFDWMFNPTNFIKIYEGNYHK